jgi:hypothetical protein
MTISMKTTGNLEGAPPEQRPRRRLDSFTDMPTHLIKLSPAFLGALRRVAPKARSRKLRYLAALAAVVSIGIAFGQRVFLHHNALAHMAPPAPPVAAPATLQPPSTLRPAGVTANASGSAPASAPRTISVEDLPRAAPAKPSNAIKSPTLKLTR